MRRTPRFGVLAVVAVVTAGIGVSGLTSSAAATTPVVHASLNFATPPAGSTVTSLALGGSYTSYLTASVVTLNSGRAVSAVSGVCCNNAIDFPTYAIAATNPPLAIVAIKNRSSAVDALNPGTGNLRWQADFAMDNYTGIDEIDGDNLVQRGLSPQKQWKLSIDRHQARCTVRTTANAPASVTPAIIIPIQTTNVRWYRAICNRTSTGVLTLTVYARNISAQAWVLFGSSTAPTSAAGDLNMTWSIPASVGGKLENTGAIEVSPSTDQFNGKVDNVVIETF